MIARRLAILAVVALAPGCVMVASNLIGRPRLSRTELPFSGGAVTVTAEAGPGLGSRASVVAVVTYPDGSTREWIMLRSTSNPTLLEAVLSIPANGAGPGEGQRYRVSVRATDGNATQEEVAGAIVVAGSLSPPAPPLEGGDV